MSEINRVHVSACLIISPNIFIIFIHIFFLSVKFLTSILRILTILDHNECITSGRGSYGFRD